VLKAVLFDLDGTLLDIDLDSFLREYFASLGPALTEVTRGEVDVQLGLQAVIAGTNAMCADIGPRTNRDVFELTFLEMTGTDLSSPEAAARIDRFYADEFAALQGSHGPRAGGIEAVLGAREAGLLVALATNPIFPLQAIRERMRWAGLDEGLFDVITSYEIMHACKPSPEYFEQVARMMGVQPSECLMVGDDAALDLPAASTGMHTYYVGDGRAEAGQARGSLADLVAVLPGLVG